MDLHAQPRRQLAGLGDPAGVTPRATARKNQKPGSDAGLFLFVMAGTSPAMTNVFQSIASRMMVRGPLGVMTVRISTCIGATWQ